MVIEKDAVYKQSTGEFDPLKHANRTAYAQEKAMAFPSNTEQFDAQIKTVTQEREQIYGKAHVNFGRMGDCEFVVRDCDDAAIKAALLMIMYKVCRLVQSPLHLDSVIDIAGYARCIAQIQDDRIGNTKP